MLSENGHLRPFRLSAKKELLFREGIAAVDGLRIRQRGWEWITHKRGAGRTRACILRCSLILVHPISKERAQKNLSPPSLLKLFTGDVPAPCRTSPQKSPHIEQPLKMKWKVAPVDQVNSKRKPVEISLSPFCFSLPSTTVKQYELIFHLTQPF